MELQFNKKAILAVLSQGMYKGDIKEVIVKELFQNAFDAVKSNQGEKTIKIVTNSFDNSITVSDNGCGMNEEVLEKAFLTLGGTHKDLEENLRSGGLGLAKAQFLLAGDLTVRTVKDGICLELSTTPDKILEEIDPPIKTEVDEQNGTTVTILLPKENKTRVTGYWTPQVLSKRLFGEVEVFFNNQKVQKEYGKELHLNFSAPWADIDVYLNLDTPDYRSSGTYFSVHSAGLFQFSEYLGYSHHSGYINIRPKVNAHHEFYPFNNQREGFKASVGQEVKRLKQFITDASKYLKSEFVAKRFSGFIDLQEVDLENGLTEEEKQRLKDIRRVEQTDSRAAITEEALVFLVSNFTGDLTQKREPIVYAEPMVAQQEFKVIENSVLKYHNNTTGEYSFAYGFFTEYANLVNKVKQEVFPDATFIVGVSIDREYQGVFLSGEIEAMFLNPFSSGINCIHSFVHHFIDTIVHELAHHQYKDHYSEFVSEMSRIYRDLRVKNSLGKYERYAEILWARHQKTILDGCAEFDRSCNVSDSLCS